jgi:hypothetical protein
VTRALWLDLRTRYRNARLADRAENRIRSERAATDPLRRTTDSFWPSRRYESVVVDHLPPVLRVQLQAKPATRDEIDPRSRNLRAIARFHNERRNKADLLRQFNAHVATIFPADPAARRETTQNARASSPAGSGSASSSPPAAVSTGFPAAGLSSARSAA